MLKIPLGKVQSSLKWEENKSGCFPHLYGAGLGQSEVECTKVFTRGVDDEWATMLEQDEWLS